MFCIRQRGRNLNFTTAETPEKAVSLFEQAMQGALARVGEKVEAEAVDTRHSHVCDLTTATIEKRKICLTLKDS